MPDSPLKWHGGKHYLAPKIVALMPPRKSDEHPGGWCHYVEPYFGGGAVLLVNDPEGISEVVNDIDGRLVNFWYCLAHAPSFAAFERAAQALPFCESLWQCAVRRLERPCETPDLICVACAAAFFTVCRQSMAGRMRDFATLSRRRTRRGMNDQASAWLTAVEGLPAVHERLTRVVILNRPALDVIRQQDGPQTLFYLDPPYLPATRTAPDVYAHEMSERDHETLLAHLTLGGLEGKVIISGYRCPLYNQVLVNWHRVDFDLPNNAAGGPEKRRMVESVWCNFKPEVSKP